MYNFVWIVFPKSIYIFFIGFNIYLPDSFIFNLDTSLNYYALSTIALKKTQINLHIILYKTTFTWNMICIIKISILTFALNSPYSRRFNYFYTFSQNKKSCLLLYHHSVGFSPSSQYTISFRNIKIKCDWVSGRWLFNAKSHFFLLSHDENKYVFDEMMIVLFVLSQPCPHED
jgi:hypothetical protein